MNSASAPGEWTERSSVNAEANPDNTYEDGSVLRSVSASDGPRGVITCHPKMVRTSVDRLTPLPNANIALRQKSASGAPTGARTSIDCSEIVCVGSAVTERKSEIWAYLPQAGLGVCHVPLGWLHAAQWPVFAQVYCLIYDERLSRPAAASAVELVDQRGPNLTEVEMEELGIAPPRMQVLAADKCSFGVEPEGFFPGHFAAPHP